MAEELIAFPSKAEMLDRSRQFWNPGKTQFWVDSGVPLGIDRRQGYFIYDVGGKRRIVSIAKAYHGHTGLAVATGDDRFSTLFLADRPDEFTHVPFNDLAAMEDALRGRDVAAVIMETIPATYGFPLPAPGYLEGT